VSARIRLEMINTLMIRRTIALNLTRPLFKGTLISMFKTSSLVYWMPS